ncbi:MAG TPA: kynureninase [Bacteroidia bacterium]|jgi:kynureninase|nr:kynureninase [Bacteroidia bacterium]
MKYVNSLAFARELDKKDSLKKFRKRFLFPKHNGKEALYFTGNSLGLQPVGVKRNLEIELEDWANYGVEGHFEARNPWVSYHEMFAEPLAKLMGAKPEEVIAMNQLTVNVHLMMVSFYRPTAKRYKILCEANAFPSDQYALQTQVEMHGLKWQDALIEISPRKGENLVRKEDILKAISDNASSLALVMIGGVNYLTGQLLDMPAITKAAHKVGAYASFDLAHAAGNVELKLHDWDVDFAVWCTYKYLNSGPGAVAGAFIHEKHIKNQKLPRFAGWWGYDKKTRFQMKHDFVPMKTAEGWQLSNAPVLSMAAHRASLDIFMEAGGMAPLCKKSRLLTGYLEFIISGLNDKMKGKKIKLEITTPTDPEQRGCQLSIIAHGMGRDFYNAMTKAGVFCDWRNPNVVRVAPTPLYNSFEDVWSFGQVVEKVLGLK